MSRMSQLTAGARTFAERRLRHLPAARRLRFELALAALERFANGRPLHVLDAGCGEGLFAETVARRHSNWTVVGADVDEELLERGRASAEKEGVANVDFLQADVTGDLGQEAFDAVVALECLEEIEQDDAAIARMAQALRAGGLLLVHVPESSWTPVLPRSERTWRNEVRHGYTVDELREKLERAGIDVFSVALTSRGMVRIAQELRDRIKNSSLKVRALAYPPLAAAVRLERWGITWGSPRALFAEGLRR